MTRFGEPILMDEYEQQFLSSDPQLVRAAVKGLTHRIESELIRFTINAPDWFVASSESLKSKTDRAFTGIHCTLLEWHGLYFGRRANLSAWTILFRSHKR